MLFLETEPMSLALKYIEIVYFQGSGRSGLEKNDETCVHAESVRSLTHAQTAHLSFPLNNEHVPLNLQIGGQWKVTSSILYLFVMQCYTMLSKLSAFTKTGILRFPQRSLGSRNSLKQLCRKPMWQLRQLQ